MHIFLFYLKYQNIFIGVCRTNTELSNFISNKYQNWQWSCWLNFDWGIYLKSNKRNKRLLYNFQDIFFNIIKNQRARILKRANELLRYQAILLKGKFCLVKTREKSNYLLIQITLWRSIFQSVSIKVLEVCKVLKFIPSKANL